MFPALYTSVIWVLWCCCGEVYSGGLVCLCHMDEARFVCWLLHTTHVICSVGDWEDAWNPVPKRGGARPAGSLGPRQTSWWPRRRRQSRSAPHHPVRPNTTFPPLRADHIAFRTSTPIAIPMARTPFLLLWPPYPCVPRCRARLGGPVRFPTGMPQPHLRCKMTSARCCI